MLVFVYFNLHKLVWSVRSLESGFAKNRVIMHARELLLRDCTTKVYEAGRQRVLRSRQKDVHAGVIGHLVCAYRPHLRDILTAQQADMLKWKTLGLQGEKQAFLDSPYVPATYNPYKGPTFVSFHGEEVRPLHHCASALFMADPYGDDTQPPWKRLLVSGAVAELRPEPIKRHAGSSGDPTSTG